MPLHLTLITSKHGRSPKQIPASDTQPPSAELSDPQSDCVACGVGVRARWRDVLISLGGDDVSMLIVGPIVAPASCAGLCGQTPAALESRTYVVLLLLLLG